LAMALWLGGLASLALIVLDRDPDARRAAERFSPLAATSVALIVVSGVFAAWRQVGWSRDAFFDTTFGRLLVVQVAFFTGLLAVPFSTEMRSTQPPMLVDVTIDPAKAGPVVIHIYTLTPSGANSYITNATATMSLPSKGIASIDVPLERAGPSHFRNTSFNI